MKSARDEKYDHVRPADADADAIRTTMNALSRREEDALTKSVRARAFKECDALVKEFVECTQGRTFSVAWTCRAQYNTLQECMYRYTKPESMDEFRSEYIRLRDFNAASKTAT